MRTTGALTKRLSFEQYVELDNFDFRHRNFDCFCFDDKSKRPKKVLIKSQMEELMVLFWLMEQRHCEFLLFVSRLYDCHTDNRASCYLHNKCWRKHYKV